MLQVFSKKHFNMAWIRLEIKVKQFFTVCREKIDHAPADMSLLPESQNKSIFTSVVWFGCIHMRISSQVVIVVVTDSTVQKSAEWEIEKMKGNIAAVKGNPRGMTLSKHTKKSKWTMKLHVTTADTCTGVIWILSQSYCILTKNAAKRGQN